MRRYTLYIILLLSVATIVYFGFVIKNGHHIKPNIIIIITDDQGWGDVGFNGNEIIKTPALDSLSETGIVLDRFYVSPVGASTRASLLTGKYYLTTAANGNSHRMEIIHKNDITIAEILKRNGYSTAYIGKWHNGEQYPHNPLGQGFDFFFGFCEENWNNYFDTKLEYQGELVQTKGYITNVFTDTIINYLGRTKEPFFTCIAYNNPHIPYQIPDQYFNNYIEKGLDDKTACIYSVYENIDDNIRRIINKLNESGKKDNTIILFLSDNGPDFIRYNGGFKGRRAQIDEGGVRVPFILYYPNGNYHNKRVTDEYASHIDILPTLLDIAQIPSDSYSFDGISLLNLLTNRENKLPERNFYTHKDFSGAVRTKDFLLTMYPGDTALYNLHNDPSQKSNIIKEFPQESEKLITQYNKWFEKLIKDTANTESFHVGYDNVQVVSLPVHSATLRGNIKFAGDIDSSYNWITNWKDSLNQLVWNVEIARKGTFSVKVLYACKEDDLNKSMKIVCQDQELNFKLTRTHEGKRYESQDRIEPDKVYERNWRIEDIGTIDLDNGQSQLALCYCENQISGIAIKGILLEKVSNETIVSDN